MAQVDPKGMGSRPPPPPPRPHGAAPGSARRLPAGVTVDLRTGRIRTPGQAALVQSPLVFAGALAIAAILGAAAVWALSGEDDSGSQSATPLQPPPSLLPAVPGGLAIPGDQAMAADAAALPSAVPELTAPPEHAVLPPQGDTVQAAPEASGDPVTAKPARPTPRTLIYDGGDADASDTGGTDTAPDGPVIIGSASRPGSVRAGPATKPRPSLTAGTVVPAILESVIDSDRPGSVRAVVSSEVRSHDGTRVLMPRLSRLEGQYRASATAREGRRALIVWTRLIRPDGRSQAIGEANAASTRFAAQFAAAPLVSMVGGAGKAGVRARPGEPIRVTTVRAIPLDASS